MATSLQCEPFLIPGQRRFWTTQQDACGTSDGCRTGTECGVPGLRRDITAEGATIGNDDWVRSLALNMLLTDARRRDTRCGHLPGSLNGHWSESFSESGVEIGSHIRYVDAGTSVRDAVLLIKAEAQATLQKLITHEIAVEIVVLAEYKGNGQIAMDIEIFGNSADPTRIGVTVQRLVNGWAWGV